MTTGGRQLSRRISRSTRPIRRTRPSPDLFSLVKLPAPPPGQGRRRKRLPPFHQAKEKPSSWPAREAAAPAVLQVGPHTSSRGPAAWRSLERPSSTGEKGVVWCTGVYTHAHTDHCRVRGPNDRNDKAGGKSECYPTPNDSAVLDRLEHALGRTHADSKDCICRSTGVKSTIILLMRAQA